jgi:hypothetical protein
MVDLSLSLVDLKQCEVTTVSVQRAKIHKEGALPVLDLGFAAEPFDCLAPASQRLGDASRPAKSLDLVQWDAVVISHEERFVRHLHASHYHPVVQPLALTKHVECIAEYIYPAVHSNIVVRLQYRLALAEDLDAHIFHQAVNSSIQRTLWHRLLCRNI